MTPAEIRQYLREVEARPVESSVTAVREALTLLKQSSVTAGDQVAAKALWCLGQTLDVQEHYLRAFQLLRQVEYYKAWCELERAEIALTSLERHGQDLWSDCRLDFIQEYTAKWQSLFPYRMFYSPEILHLEKQCSVCKQTVLPRAFCGHRVGEIYNGEMCYRIITKLKMLGISIVDKPEQKYSVLFVVDKESREQRDHYRYDLVQYAVNALRGPFDAWDVERTTLRQPHERFAHVARSEPCPCDSGKKYEECCLLESGVVRPHFEFSFFIPPPNGTANEVYLD